MEECESRADLEDHIASEKFQIILSFIELSIKLPEIELNTISRAEGLYQLS
jgi:hypothetical protein